ncbi:MarR family winged helix-turn-helix transcriptional regulator [Nocardia pseudobrasiliensis]|uniref:DNA-binding MarR family transcriptional regulator n=1 Tax=Nocardia pseudobrasiliensis TaxID=45979 RepID=A0A370I0U4_9NOCA|nr:MarR family transcriptional regulator [Nocardia pseudobrasiliensis]RDI64190.1 DNA-binding MarR family transcriptional regulator [Nocardia pseudobrasiliensis]
MELTTVPDTPEREVVGTLLRTFGRFRRQVGRLAGRSFDRSGVSTSQAEFLRLVGRNPGISVKEAAGELGLAPNSVSTFVTALVQAGLLERQSDSADRRVMRLSLPVRVQAQVDETRRRHHDLIATALAELTSEEREELIRGLAVMNKVTDSLHRRETKGNR